MLQLSFWLGFWFTFFALPGTRGAISVNLSLNATPSGGLDAHSDLIMCVDSAQHPSWAGPAQDRFDLEACQQAVNLIFGRVQGKLYNSYDFFSRQVYPSGPAAIGYEAWPLAQGASSG